jgi:hypothetical protein
MSNLTAAYEASILSTNWEEEEDVDLDYYEEPDFDATTQIKLRYGFNSVSVTLTPELNEMSLKDIVASYQGALGFQNINEVSVRDSSAFIDQSTNPIVGTEYVLAAVGDSKGV